MRLTLSLILVLLMLPIEVRSENELQDRPKLIAHRGGIVDDQRIENNLAAIEEAVRRRYYMLEVDIRESKDGHLVVHHDANFSRFYGDNRRVSDLTWEEIKRIRSKTGRLRPIDLSEFAAACKGKIRLMLDVKGPDHDEAFFEELTRMLADSDLLATAFAIGTEQARGYLKGKCKVGIDAQQLTKAIEAGEDVDRLYFLFEHGDMTAESIELAQQHGVVVVPSVNVFHYPKDHMNQAARDLEQLLGLGVTHFQIDSVYEQFCRRDGYEIRRYQAPEAVQAVAVDTDFFYAIANKTIGKYKKRTGELVKRWQSRKDISLTHLNSGTVRDGKLYCAHSNYPRHPMTSSVEIWNASNLEHVDSHSFGIYEGSLTWVDWHDESWWAVFAHYSTPTRANRATDNSSTSLVRFDSEWRRLGAWTFPQTVLDRFHPHSCSGGSWGPDASIYCSGHDHGEIYQLRLPRSGSTLVHSATLQVPITGQGFAWDRGKSFEVFGINRPKQEVLVWKLFE